ncbi:MAG: hypothetical protein ACXVRU_13600 [Gaiellaceae bacterium]
MGSKRAARLRLRERSRRQCGTVAIVIALCGCVAAAAPAAVPSTPSNAQCAAAWSAATNARWHVYAAGMGVRRAGTFGWGVAKRVNGKRVNGKLVTTRRGCSVRLWLARRQGAFQDAELLYANWAHGAARYGSPPAGGGRSGPRHVHVRTSTRFANARVRSDGTLAFVGTDIPEDA